MRYSRSLGQIFLRDKNYINKIVNSLEVEGEEVLEIGAGKGEITELLIKKVKFLYCVELDSRFCNFLREKFKNLSNIKIIKGDILKFPLDKLKKKIVIFGNVPYQISTSLIRYLVNNRNYIKLSYLTFQKEFARKLTALPSTKSYTFLTCYIQYYAKVKKLFDIPARCFYPSPKVSSSLVRIEFYPFKKLANNEQYLFKIIKKAFSQRRKKLINALSLPKKNQKIISFLNIPYSARAEDISLADYIRLAEILKN